MSTESSIEEQTPVKPCPHFHGFYAEWGGVLLCSRSDYERYNQHEKERPLWFKFCPECGQQLLSDTSENLMPFVRNTLNYPR